jgi:TPR repeat protein
MKNVLALEAMVIAAAFRLAAAQANPAGSGTWAGSWDAETHIQQPTSDLQTRRAKDLLDQCGAAFKAGRYEDAFRLCRQSVAMGNIEANHGLAILYQVAYHDYAQAAHYYEKCTDQLPAAAHGLGWLYWRGGPGFPVNFPKARFYFEKAVKGGYRESITALGFMDELAQGGPWDRPRAKARLAAAAKMGDGWAKDCLVALQDPKAPRFQTPEELGVYAADVRFRIWLQSQPLDPPPADGGWNLTRMMRFCQATKGASVGCANSPGWR